MLKARHPAGCFVCCARPQQHGGEPVPPISQPALAPFLSPAVTAVCARRRQRLLLSQHTAVETDVEPLLAPLLQAHPAAAGTTAPGSAGAAGDALPKGVAAAGGAPENNVDAAAAAAAVHIVVEETPSA